jgi:hypothetical protein
MAPDIEIDVDFELQEVEVIDADAIQGLQGDPEALPEIPEAAPPEGPPELTPAELEQMRLEEEKRLEEENRLKEEEEKRKQEEAEKKAKEDAANKQYASRGSNADAMAPPQSTFHALMIPKRIRKLPFAEKAADVLAPWPDFALLVEKGGFDPLRDFDHIVIASPDIRDWRQTFLAVDYTMTPEQLQAGIERAVRRNGEQIEWTEVGGILHGNPRPIDPDEPDVDERYFVLLPDKIAVYAHKKFLPHVLSGPKGEDKTAGNFVANLTQMKRYAARQPGSGLQLKVSEFQRAFKIGRVSADVPLDRISEAELSVEASRDPQLVLRVEFVDLVSAKKAELLWTTTLKALIDDKIAIRIYVGPIYDSAKFERSGKSITIRGQFNETQIVWLLDQVGQNFGKMMKKSPEELEKERQERLDNWKRRNEGKLGPAGLDEPVE